MAAGQITSEPADTPATALAERLKLRKHFGRFDILFFLLCRTELTPENGELVVARQ